jgi:hypothetical protein
MPVKRRGAAKARLTYSPVVAALLAGERIARTEEARSELVGIQYFSWSDRSVPAEASEMAAAELGRWCEEDKACL